MNDALKLIEGERRRQREKGFDAAHDDARTDGSLRLAAETILCDLGGETASSWPQELAVYVGEKYASSPIRQITIAAALLAAEIERLQRAGGFGEIAG